MSSSIPRRPYRDTGAELSIVGFGGIVVMDAEQDHANRVVAEAIERGVNYFDVAPSYGDAQDKLGPALEPYREDVFLACKTGERQRLAAEQDFARSLEILRTDYFDLYQLHGLGHEEDNIDPAFAKGGVMEMVTEKRKSGQIRNVGFSAHTEEAALTAMDRYDFDSVLIAVNFATYYKGGFGQAVIEKAVEKGMAVLALKSMAKEQWTERDPVRDRFPKPWYRPLDIPEEVELALRWTLSQPVTAAIPPGEEDLWRMAVEFAGRFTPVTPEEEARLRDYAATLNPIFPLT